MKFLKSSGPPSVMTGYLNQYRYVILVVALQAACAVYARVIAPGRPILSLGDRIVDILTIVPYPIYAVLAFRLYVLTYIDRVPNRTAALKEEVSAFLRNGPALLRGGITLLLLIAGLAAFGTSKRLVAVLGEFSWDPALAEIDRALFFGQDPWRIVHDLIGSQWTLTVLTVCYTLWFTILLGTMVIASFARQNQVTRMQFLIAHCLSWFLIGTVFATVLSSAGPVYHLERGLGETFMPLIAILDAHAETVTHSARVLQKAIWAFHSIPEGGFSVISAMPSMHVASSLVIALYAFTAGRWIGWLLVGFTFLIFVGSFMLAWHYFLDGVVSLIAVAMIWRFSGFLARRVIRQTAQDGQTNG